MHIHCIIALVFITLDLLVIKVMGARGALWYFCNIGYNRFLHKHLILALVYTLFVVQEGHFGTLNNVKRRPLEVVIAFPCFML